MRRLPVLFSLLALSSCAGSSSGPAETKDDSPSEGADGPSRNDAPGGPSRGDEPAGPSEPSEAVLSACSGLLDAYEGECGHALDVRVEGGVCGTGYKYVPACQGELIEFLECMTGSPFNCYDPEDIVMPYECDNTGWSFKHYVDPSLPPLNGDKGEGASPSGCTGSASSCSSYSPGSCAEHGCGTCQ